MPRDKINSNSPEEKARFDAEKSLLRTEVLGHLDKLDETLKDRGKRVDRDKILEIFNESARGSQREKIVINENTRTKILKDKSGNKREKIKIVRGKVLKIKDRNNHEFLNIDLDKDDLKRNVGDWLLDLKKEVVPENVEKVPVVRNNSITLEKGKKGSHDLANDTDGEASNYDIDLTDITGHSSGVSIRQSHGKINFGDDLPVGEYEVKWKAKNEKGWSEMATLTVTINEVVPVVTPEDNEKFNEALAKLKTKIKDVDAPKLGNPTGYNLEAVEGQIVSAEEAYALALAAAAGSPELLKKLKPFRKEIDELKEKLESLQREKEENFAELKNNIEAEVKKAKEIQTEEEKQQKAEVEKVEQSMKDAQDKIAKNQAEVAAKSKASFDAINGKTWQIESETSFNGDNLRSLEGVQHEMAKHDFEVQKFEAEMQVMDKGMAHMEQKFAEFEEEKGNVGWGKGLKVGGGILGSVALGAGAGMMLGGVGTAAMIAAAPAVVSGAVVVGAVVAARNLWSWASRKWGNKKKATAWKNGSLLGWLTGENRVAKEKQQEKIKFEGKYKEYSEILQAKEANLKTDGEQIRSAASNTEELLSERADKVVAESGIEETLTDLHSKIGMEVPPTLINDKIEEIKTAVRSGDTKIQADLAAKSSASETTDARIIAGENSAHLGQTERRLGVLNFQAADIGDYTFGALGKFLKKGKDLPIVGGVANGIGELSSGFNTLISEPEKVIEGVGKLVGIGLEEGETAGQAWNGMKNWLIAKESWDNANSVGDYWNWATEMGFNFWLTFSSFGTRGALQTGKISGLGQKTLLAKKLTNKGWVKTANVVDRVTYTPVRGFNKSIGKDGLWSLRPGKGRWKNLWEKGVDKAKNFSFRGKKFNKKRATKDLETIKSSRAKIKELDKVKDVKEIESLQQKINKAEKSLFENNKLKLQKEVAELEAERTQLKKMEDTKIFPDNLNAAEVTKRLNQVEKNLAAKTKFLNKEFKVPYEGVGEAVEPGFWARVKNKWNNRKNKKSGAEKPAKKRNLFQKVREKLSRKNKNKVNLKEKSVEQLKEDLNKASSAEKPKKQESLTKAEKLEKNIIESTAEKMDKLIKEKAELKNKTGRFRKNSRNERIAKIDGEIRELKEKAMEQGVHEGRLLQEIRAKNYELSDFFENELKVFNKTEALKKVEIEFKTGEFKVTNADKSTTTFKNTNNLKIDGKNYQIEEITNNEISLKEITKTKKGKAVEFGRKKTFTENNFKKLIKEEKVEL